MSNIPAVSSVSAPSLHHGVVPTAETDCNRRNSNVNYDDDDDDDNYSQSSYVCQFNQQSSKWECVKAEYKSVVLQQVMDQYENKDGSRATIDQLKEFGITVYLAEHDSVNMFLLKQVVCHLQASKSDRSKSLYETQRCLLYRDENGRLFNLTLNNGCSGLAGTWKSLLLSFSGFQALVALTVLSRAFACANVVDIVLKPAYIGVILGLILFEEISHVWMNVAMCVRGVPSVAAFTLISNFDSDWPRKAVVFLFAITSAMEEGSAYQRYSTLTAIGLAMMLLAGNLGARAWYFMKWKPLHSGGLMSTIFAPIISLFVAALVGVIFPYIGFNKIQAGGKAAIQLIIFNTIVVGLVFVASDLDVVQQFIVVGSDVCDQSNVNITLGIWFTMTALTCIVAAQKIVPSDPHPEDSDPILVEEQTSPVGYKIPNFPDYPIDPIHFGSKGCECLPLKLEVFVGFLVSIGIGAFILSTGFYDYMFYWNEYITSSASSGQ